MISFDFGSKNFLLTFEVNDNKEIRVYNKEIFKTLSEKNKQFLKDYSYLCDVRIEGGDDFICSGDRNVVSGEGVALKYVEHKLEKNKLTIVQQNKNIKVTSCYIYDETSDTLLTFNKVKNVTNENINLKYLSSFALYFALSSNSYFDSEIYVPYNSWYSEVQWRKYSPNDLGIFGYQELKTFQSFKMSNVGSFSTKKFLPAILIHDTKLNRFTHFNILSNNSWEIETGDFASSLSLHLSTISPTLENRRNLSPNEEYESSKIVISSGESLNKVLSKITSFRRVNSLATKKHNSVIFNEYMICSWVTPSEQTALQLAPIAKEMGAEYYVIDCGWHDEVENPFNYIGKWKESKTNYPHGLMNTLDFIRSQGLKVGLWMEPECVGQKGDAKSFYDDDCFFKVNGKPLIFAERYILNFANKKVYEAMFKKVCGVIDTYKLDYLKIDYNRDVGPGGEMYSDSLGHQLDEHAKAVARFYKELKKKYPDVLIEGCASGGNRHDDLSTSVFDIISYSDQHVFSLIPFITSNISSALLPEKTGVWATPRLEDDSQSDEDVVLIMANSLMGRITLGSKLYLLPEQQKKLTKESIEVYKSYRDDISSSVPYLPLGFSNAKDKILSYGLENDKYVLLNVTILEKDLEAIIPIDFDVKDIEIIYPTALNTNYKFVDGKLIVKAGSKNFARIFKLYK